MFFNILFLYSIVLQPLVCLALQMDLFSMNDFVTSCIGHFENNGSSSKVDLPNIDIFHYVISFKNHILISPLISSKKS